MKIIKLLIIALTISSAYAEMYKCQIKGQISYQDSACQTQGNLFKKKFDISSDQQKAAFATLNDQLLAKRELKEQLEKAAVTERRIRAEEENSYANIQNAIQSERQANALEQRNSIEQRKIRQGTRYRFFNNNQRLYPR